MKFDYYSALSTEALRIKDIFKSEKTQRETLKLESDKWREMIADRLGEDFLPPMDRRDLLSLIQNLSYISYEVKRLPGLGRFDSAEGLLLKNALNHCLEALIDETNKLKKRESCPLRLRRKAYGLLSVWHSSLVAHCDPLLCDGYEAAGDAILRYADALETAIMDIA